MVPRSRVQSDYAGFTYLGNSVKNDLNNNNNENELKEEND